VIQHLGNLLLVEMTAVQTLAPGEDVPGRAFADPANTLHDLAALSAMHRALRIRVRSHPSGGRWSEAGVEHWLVVPDPVSLGATRPVVGVGFFGQTRKEVDHEPILRLEHDLLARAVSFPGLLAYHNVRFADGQWGNLVLFASDGDPAHVRADPIHAEAIGRTALHYRSLRLHRLRLSGGALGASALDLVSTLLIDFAQIPPWRAIRPGQP
jgi:hypothetical protein